jgi:anti-sigma28 factor (negative regulator of flagellin synthesis)
MKVHSEQVNGGFTQQTAKTSESRAVERSSQFRTPGAIAPNGDDRVELSGFAARIAEADRAAASAQASRLQELAKAYQSGKYSVDSAQLGRALLDAGVLYV